MLNEQTNVSPTRNSPTTLMQKCGDSPPSLVPSDYEAYDFDLECHAAHPQTDGTSPFPNRDQREYMARYNRDAPFDDPVRNYASTMKHLEKLEQLQSTAESSSDDVDTIEPTSDPESVSIVGPSHRQRSEDKDISLLEPPAKCQCVGDDMVGENSQLQKLLEEVCKIKEIYKATIKVQMEQTAAQLKVAEQLTEALTK
ncbi:hypothetical protein K439DRAFT_1615929 [Ramaria rubella]|nr:hypothetical protein K439DRAFT_1615929 [Ramaria rubella]